MVEALTDILALSWRSGLEVIRTTSLAALFFLFLGMLVKGRSLFADMQRATAQTGLNLKIILFNLIFVAPLIVILTQGLVWLFQIREFTLINRQAWTGLPHWTVLAIGVFIGDLVGYWRHRLEHSRYLWPSHAVHHSDTEMTFLTLERFHPINRISTFVVDTAVLLVLGLPTSAIIASNLVRHYYGFFIHADLPWTYGPLGRLFVSPAMHRWHHAKDKAAFNTNYATVFSIFDQAFGTFRVLGPCTVPLGVTDNIPLTLAGQIRHAFRAQAYRRRPKSPAKAAAGGQGGRCLMHADWREVMRAGQSEGQRAVGDQRQLLPVRAVDGKH